MLFALPVHARVLESFEDTAIGHMPPVGWLKWQEAGGRGWSNSWAGRMPLPGWMSGTNSTPPGGGDRMAYVTYTHGGAKTNDLWLISPTLKGINATSTVSFWQRNTYTNFADSLRMWISTNPAASQKSDFTIEAWMLDMPRGQIPGFVPPGTGDHGGWSNAVVPVGSLVPSGSDIRIAFQEFHANNWYDVRAIELDLITSDLWAEPWATTTAVRAQGRIMEVDYTIFAGYPRGTMGVCWSPGPNPVVMDASRNEWFQGFVTTTNQGVGTLVISNMPSDTTWYLRTFVQHEQGVYYGNTLTVHPADSAGEGYLLESFENVPVGQMPPPGWAKWQEAGGRGWSNSWAGRQPLPGWMSGTNTTPLGGGERTAYVTYTLGGAKTNDLWLVTPTIRNIPPGSKLRFWHRNAFTNFADNLYVHLSTNTNAYRKIDFTSELWHLSMSRGEIPGYVPPGTGDFGEWSQVEINLEVAATAGDDVRIAFQQYHPNNWYDVRAIELDLIEVGTRDVRYGLWFDGADDYAVMTPGNQPSAFTMEAWVKPLSIKAQTILVRSTGDPGVSCPTLLGMNGSGQFVFQNNDGTVKLATGSTVAQTGRWYHVAGVAQNNGSMRLLVNGVEEGTASIGVLPSDLDQVYAGIAACAGSYGYFHGMLDELRLWSTPRTADEVRALMNVYLRGTEAGLDACYRLDSTWGETLFDSSPQEHTASLAAIPAGSKPAWMPTASPLAPYTIAEETEPQAIWPAQTSSASTNGLSISVDLIDATNSVFFSHNGLAGVAADDLPPGQPARRLARVWYVVLSGLDQQTADFVFTPEQAGAGILFDAAATYRLLRRDASTGAFTDTGAGVASAVDGHITFTGITLTTGYYTLARLATGAPSGLNASAITIDSFTAGWDAVPLATNYWIDVASNAGFSAMVDGYSDRMVGPFNAQAVTGLLPGVTYSWRVRADSPGGVSTSSLTATTTTLLESFITFDPLSPVKLEATTGLVATATSGLVVSFSVVDGPGEITGLTNLSFTSVGDVIVEANQAGNDVYAAAPPVSRTVKVYSVTPDHGPLTGGTLVVVSNGLFGTVTNVLIGNPDPVAVVPGSVGINWFALSTPSAAETGTVDVVVQTEEYDDLTLPGAFRYQLMPPVAGPVTLWRITNQLLKASDLLLLTNSVDPQGSALSVVWVAADATNGGTAALSGRWVVYTPPPGEAAPDQFVFRVQNALGLSSDTTANILILSPVAEGSSMNVASVTPTATNTMVRLVGIPGRAYDVQSTTNLVDPAWQTIGDIVIGDQGYTLFLDTNTPAAQYYRTIRP